MRLVFLLFLLSAILLALGNAFAAPDPAVAGALAPAPAPGAVAGAPPTTTDLLTTFLVPLITAHPVIATIFLVVGALRFLIKPLIAAAHWYADQTDSPKDNEFIARIEASKVLRSVLFVLDWLASVKTRR